MFKFMACDWNFTLQISASVSGESEIPSVKLSPEEKCITLRLT